MCRSLDPTLPHHKYSISLLLVWAKSLFPAFCCERSRNSTEKHFYRLTPPQQPANQSTEDQKQLWKLRPVLPNRQILYGLGLSICLFFNPFSWFWWAITLSETTLFAFFTFKSQGLCAIPFAWVSIPSHIHPCSSILEHSSLNPPLSDFTVAVVVQSLSCVWLFATSWTAAHQASQSFTIL